MLVLMQVQKDPSIEEFNFQKFLTVDKKNYVISQQHQN